MSSSNIEDRTNLNDFLINRLHTDSYRDYINDHTRDYYFSHGYIKCPIHGYNGFKTNSLLTHISADMAGKRLLADQSYKVNEIDKIYAWHFTLYFVIIPLLLMPIGLILYYYVEEHSPINKRKAATIGVSVVLIILLLIPQIHSMILGIKPGAVNDDGTGCYDGMLIMRNVIKNHEEEKGVLPDSLWTKTMESRIPHQLDLLQCPTGGEYTFKQRRINCSIHGSPDFAQVPVQIVK